MTENKKLLLLFDGGNAPGYMAVATSLTEEGDKRGYTIYAAFEGFRSLTGDNLLDERLIRLVMSRRDSWRLNSQGIPTRSLYRAVDRPGSEFRSERYADFKKPEKQAAAAKYISSMGFTHVIGVGGNGTMKGIKSLNKLLPETLTGFVNVSVDSDILGDIAVGYFTAAEEGAKIARGLFDDAFTHKRIYLLEMMGRNSGKHALMAGGSARAHLIILPRFKFTKTVLKDMAARLNEADHAVVVVAEGYDREARAKYLHGPVNAAAHFKTQLRENGLYESNLKRVISEPYSRYLRGIRPLYIECAIAFLKAFILFDAFEKNKTQVMPYYLGEHDHGIRHFSELVTNNSVEPRFLDLIDRFDIPSLRQYVSCEFKDMCGLPASKAGNSPLFD